MMASRSDISDAIEQASARLIRAAKEGDRPVVEALTSVIRDLWGLYVLAVKADIQ